MKSDKYSVTQDQGQGKLIVVASFKTRKAAIEEATTLRKDNPKTFVLPFGAIRN